MSYELLGVRTGHVPLISEDGARMLVIVDVLDLRTEPCTREHLVELRIRDGAIVTAIQPNGGSAHHADPDSLAYLETLRLRQHPSVVAALALAGKESP